MKKLTLSIVAALLFAMGGVMPSYSGERVVIAQTNDVILWAPIYVARKMGYFEKQGLDIEVIPVSGGPATLAAVEAGNADIATGFPATPINAAAAGHDVKMFASLTTEYVAELVIQGDVAKKLDIDKNTSVEDKIRRLKGLKLGTNAAGSAADYMLQHLVKHVGMQPDSDLTIVPVGKTPTLLAAFERKRIDGFMATPPANDIAIKKYGAFQLIDFASGEYAPVSGMLYVAMSANRNWLEENPETAARVVWAINKALALINNDPAAAKEAVRSFFKDMDQETFDAGWNSTVASFPPNARLEEDGVTKILDFMAIMYGKRVDIDLDKIYTNKYYDMAKLLK